MSSSSTGFTFCPHCGDRLQETFGAHMNWCSGAKDSHPVETDGGRETHKGYGCDPFAFECPEGHRHVDVKNMKVVCDKCNRRYEIDDCTDLAASSST